MVEGSTALAHGEAIEFARNTMTRVTTSPDEPPRVIARSHAAGVGLAGFLSAGVSYVVLVVAARVLSPEQNALFLAYWALLFGVYGVLTGLNAESARAGHNAESIQGTRPRVVGVALGFGAVLCGAFGLSSLLWNGAVLSPGYAWLSVVVAAAGATFSGHLSLTGVFAGQGRWRLLILATVFESLLRLVFVLLVLGVARSLAGLAVASALSAAAWLGLLVLPVARQSLKARADVSGTRLVANFGHASVASAASAALVVGFPVLVRLTSGREEFLGSAGLLLAVSLTRAPLMVPLGAYQGVAINYMMNHRGGPRALLRIVALVVAVSSVAAVAAAIVGPSLFELVLGGRYTVKGSTLAGLTLGAGALCLVTLTGVSALTVGRHRVYSFGWLVATIAALVILSTPIPLYTRTVWALLLGPLFGASVHLLGVSTVARSEQRFPRESS